MNLTYAETDAVAKQIPATPHMTLDEALRISPQLRTMVESDERIKKLVDTARGLEGMPRNTSTHAAGVVITANPVSDYVPLARNDETIVTQFTMTTIEELGLLKMDFLGLRNLTILDDAARAIRRREPDFDLKRLPDGDAATFAMLGDGKTAGVFQLESAGITGVCVNQKPQFHRGLPRHRRPLPPRAPWTPSRALLRTNPTRSCITISARSSSRSSP